MLKYKSMVAIKIRYSEATFYIIGDFWEIVERLKARGAWFRFRSRRWRWPGSLDELREAVQPYEVEEGGFSPAQAHQLAYDREHIEPDREWLRGHIRLVRLSVEWWEAVKPGSRQERKALRQFHIHQERAGLALTSLDIPASELSREQLTALQQTRRAVEKYESRIVKWLAVQSKVRRQEEILRRFEREMGYSRENLLEAERARGSARQALYEEVSGLDWLPHEVSELKAAARNLLKESKKAKIA